MYMCVCVCSGDGGGGGGRVYNSGLGDSFGGWRRRRKNPGPGIGEGGRGLYVGIASSTCAQQSSVGVVMSRLLAHLFPTLLPGRFPSGETTKEREKTKNKETLSFIPDP